MGKIGAVFVIRRGKTSAFAEKAKKRKKWRGAKDASWGKRDTKKEPGRGMHASCPTGTETTKKARHQTSKKNGIGADGKGTKSQKDANEFSHPGRETPAGSQRKGGRDCYLSSFL